MITTSLFTSVILQDKSIINTLKGKCCLFLARLSFKIAAYTVILPLLETILCICHSICL